MAFIVSKINMGLMKAMGSTKRLGLLEGLGTGVSRGRRWGVSDMNYGLPVVLY